MARRVVEPDRADPYQRWKEARLRRLEQRRAVQVAALAGFALLLLAAVARAEDWTATVLAVGLVPFATQLTGYYSAVLVVYALLWERHRGVAAGLVGLSAFGWAVVQHFHAAGIAALRAARSMDEIMTWISVGKLLFVVLATFRVGALERRAARGSPGTSRHGAARAAGAARPYLP